MKKTKSLNISRAALFTALVFIAAKIINIPTPIGGVINISDALILTLSLITSRSEAVLTSGLGAFLAEVFSPYAIFAPATLIIKSSIAFISNTLHKHMKIHNENLRIIISFSLAESVMIIGYFIYQAFFLGLGIPTASLDIINNIIQASASVVIGFSLYKLIIKSKIIKKAV